MTLYFSEQQLLGFFAGSGLVGCLSTILWWWLRQKWLQRLELEKQRTLQSFEIEHALMERDFDSANRELIEYRSRCGELSDTIDELQQQLSQKSQHLAVLQARYDAEQQSERDRLQTLQENSERMMKEFSLLSHKIFEEKQTQFQEQSRMALNASTEPLRQQIEQFRKKVEDVYDKESSERNQLVGQIVELQKQARQIGSDAVTLARALKGNNKTQGNWGEVVLERILEQSGLEKGREYKLQPSLNNEHGQRRLPDVVISLPEDKHIVVDSKVSLVHFEQYINAATDEERVNAVKRHLSSVKNHIQQLSHKSYDQLEGINSLDFVFMFLPVDSALYLAMQEDASLFQSAYDQHVILVSPSSLMVTLRTVDNIWRYQKQNQNAEAIAQQAGGLHDQFVLLLEALDDIDRQIKKAGEAYQTARSRLVDGRGNLIRRVEGLRALGAKVRRQIPDMVQGAETDWHPTIEVDERNQ